MRDLISGVVVQTMLKAVDCRYTLDLVRALRRPQRPCC
jgi:hypothetical protein